MNLVKPPEDLSKDMLIIIGISLVTLTIIFMIAMALTSCTISFQNFDTHGTATDLVDEDQKASPDIKTDLSIPASLL